MPKKTRPARDKKAVATPAHAQGAVPEDLRVAFNAAFKLVEAICAAERDTSEIAASSDEFRELYRGANAAFDPVEAELTLCPHGTMPNGQNVFTFLFRRATDMRAGRTSLVPSDKHAIAETMLRNVNGVMLQRAELARRTPHNGESEGIPGEFVPASILFKDRFTTYKQLTAWLKSNPQIRIRKPSPQRLEISAGDWVRHWAAEDKRAFDGLEAPADAVDYAVEASQRQEGTREGWTEKTQQRRARGKSLPQKRKNNLGK